MEGRRDATVSWVIPATIIAATLIALIALPLVMNDRINRHRIAIQEEAEPARHDLNEVNYQLSIQVSSLQRAMLTGLESHSETFRAAAAARAGAMDRLKVDVERMDDHSRRRFMYLEQAIARWEASVARTIESPEIREEYAVSPGHSDYVEVVESVKELDEGIAAFQRQHSDAIQRLMRLQMQLTFALIAMALLALGSVLWLVSRLNALARSLARESAERMEGLERERAARSTAEELIRARDEILGIVSHDLRSPLSTITLSTQMLPNSPPEAQSEHVDMVLTAARRMERLIQDLLDAVKLENRALSIRTKPLDPEALAREVFHSHQPIAADKEIDLTLEVDGPLPEVNGDRDRLVQALSNLLGNALKFTPEKGRVRMTASSIPGHVRFDVIDSGSGISDSDLPHLFDPFWQSKKTAHLGAGLGLKITRAIVEAHGGTIDVSNQGSGGACFSIKIPAAD